MSDTDTNTDITPESAPKKETYVSLVETLSFLEDIGAGDPTHDQAVAKADLTLSSAKSHVETVKQRLNLTDTPPASLKKTATKADKGSSNFNHPNKFQTRSLDPYSNNAQPVNTDQVHKVHLQLSALDQQKTNPLQKHSDIVQKARKQAASAQSLEHLCEIIHNFEGCPLKLTATNTVFSDGNPDADIMLVGEAPGADEDRFGKPFVGRSGQLLDKMMAAIRLTRQQDYYISNIIPWRPPGNRPPTPEETAICLPFIQRHIQLKQPKYLICIGGTAAKALLSTKESMGRLRGKWFDYKAYAPSHLQEESGDDLQQSHTIPTTVLFHPSYLLRSPGQKKLAWEDLQKIESFFLTK